MDHLSDAFMDVFKPLNSLVKAAKEGDRAQVEVAARKFEEHANTMLKVEGRAVALILKVHTHIHACTHACTHARQASRMLCSLSRDVDGIQITKMAAKHVSTLIPQVWLSC